MKRICLLAFILTLGCNGDDAPGVPPSPCPAGQTKRDGHCLPICAADRDCTIDEVCIDSTCLDKVQAGWPTIAMVDGDSAESDSGDAHAVHRFASALVISGQNLQAADATLTTTSDGASSFPALEQRSRGATELVVVLPSALAPGDYVLSVANELGRAEHTLTILRGEDGAAGVCSNTQCTDAVASLDTGVVGADAVTSLALRAVNGGGEREVVLGDAASFDTGNQDGVFVLSIARASHQASDNADLQRNYAITGAGSDPNLTALLAVLTGIDESRFLVLVSRGDISGRLRPAADGTPTPLFTALSEFGASDRLARLRATDALVFVGIRGMGAGNAVQLVATGAAAGRVLLVDRDLVGPSTASRYSGSDFAVSRQANCSQGKSVIGVTAEGLWVCDTARVAADGGLTVGGDGALSATLGARIEGGEIATGAVGLQHLAPGACPAGAWLRLRNGAWQCETPSLDGLTAPVTCNGGQTFLRYTAAGGWSCAAGGGGEGGGTTYNFDASFDVIASSDVSLRGGGVGLDKLALPVGCDHGERLEVVGVEDGTQSTLAWDCVRSATTVLALSATVPARQALLGDTNLGVTNDTAGLWVGAIRTDTMTLDAAPFIHLDFTDYHLSSNFADSNNDRLALVDLLGQVARDQSVAHILIVLSRGNYRNVLSPDIRAILKEFGAADNFDAILDGDLPQAYVLIGQYGLGEGGGLSRYGATASVSTQLLGASILGLSARPYASVTASGVLSAADYTRFSTVDHKLDGGAVLTVDQGASAVQVAGDVRVENNVSIAGDTTFAGNVRQTGEVELNGNRLVMNKLCAVASSAACVGSPFRVSVGGTDDRDLLGLYSRGDNSGAIQVHNEGGAPGELQLQPEGGVVNVGGTFTVNGTGAHTMAGELILSGSASAGNFAFTVNNQADTGYSTVKLGQTSDSDAGIYRNGPAQTNYFGASSLMIGTIANVPFGVITNNTRRLVVTGSGNVGIGTATPTGILELMSSPDRRIIFDHNGESALIKVRNTANASIPLELNPGGEVVLGGQRNGGGSSASVFVPKLAGIGNRLVCVNQDGELYAGTATACD